MQSNQLPDNLKSRLSRVYVDNRQFKDDNGQQVNYSRLVHEVMIKGEPVNIEVKLDKKDIMLLQLADVVDSPQNASF